MRIASSTDAIVLVQNAADRATRLPNPLLDQVTYNKGTQSLERWNGSGWVSDINSSAGLPTFASQAARDAAYPAPAVDQKAYRTDTRVIERWNGSAWVSDITGGETFGVYASAAARDAAIPAPTVNQKVIRTDTNSLDRWTGSAWVQDVKTGVGVPGVASVSARTSQYPSPVSGNQVVRTDYGAIERYTGSAWVTDTASKLHENPVGKGADPTGAADSRQAFLDAEALGRDIGLAKGTYKFASNVTLAGTYRFEKGAILQPASGVTVTLTGHIDAGHYQLFDTSAGGHVKIGVGRPLQPVSLFWWGVKADAEQSGGYNSTASRDGQATSGSTAFFTNSGHFAQSDVGKHILLGNVGADYTLWQFHHTTIAAVTDAKNITLSAAPSFTANSLTYNFGTDDSVVLAEAVASIPDYSTIDLPNGSYVFGVAGTVSFFNRVALTMRSGVEPQQGGGAPVFLWVGPTTAGNKAFDLNRAQHFRFEGFALDGFFACDVGIEMDQTSAGNICTNNTIDRLLVGGFRVADIRNSWVSSNNCEYHHIRNCRLSGGGGAENLNSDRYGWSITSGSHDLYAPTPAPTSAAATPSGSGGTIPAGTYYYTIHALNVTAVSAPSNEVTATVTGTTSSVGLTWASVAGATGYRIARGTSAGAESISWDVGAVTSYTDTNAASSAFDHTQVGGSSGNLFVAADVGKRVRMTDAQALGTALDTTIATFVDSRHVTLTAAAGRTTLWNQYSVLGGKTGIGFLNGPSANAKRIEFYNNQIQGLDVGIKSLGGSVQLYMNSFTDNELNHWVAGATEPSIDSTSNAEFCRQHLRVDATYQVLMDALRADMESVAPNSFYLYAPSADAKVRVHALALENTLPSKTYLLNVSAPQGTWQVRGLKTGVTMSANQIFGFDVFDPYFTTLQSFEDFTTNITGMPAAHWLGGGLYTSRGGGPGSALIGRTFSDGNGATGTRVGVRGETMVVPGSGGGDRMVGVQGASLPGNTRNWVSTIADALQGLQPVSAAGGGGALTQANGLHVTSPDATLGGTIAKAYGVDIEPQYDPTKNITAGRGLNQKGGADPNHLAGAVRAGASNVTAAPVATLEVYGGLRTTVLPTPSAPTVVNIGTPGGTTYAYGIVAVDAAGRRTLPSAQTSTTTSVGSGSLNGTNFNRVTWTSVPGAAYYYVTGRNGTGVAFGPIPAIPEVATQTFDDTGLLWGEGGFTPPTADETGLSQLDGPVAYGAKVTTKVVAVTVAGAGTDTFDASKLTTRRITANGSITVANPTNTPADGDRLVLDILNNTAGAITVTLGSAFLGTFTAGAAGKRRTQPYTYDGTATKWVPEGAQSGDL